MPILLALLIAGCTDQPPPVDDTAGESLVCGVGPLDAAAPPWLPTPMVQGDPDSVTAGEVILGASYDEPAYIFALTTAGEWLWAHRIDEDRTVVQATCNVGSPGIRTATFDSLLANPVAQGMVLDNDGVATEEIGLEWAHHVYHQHDDGTLTWLALDVRDWTNPKDGSFGPVVGDALMETAPDGTTTIISTTWDWLEVEPNAGWIISVYPMGKDWTHANGIQYLPETDSYLVSFYQLDTVAEIDRQTGQPLRWITARPDLPVPDGVELLVLDDAFHHPHDPTITDDGTLLMVSTQGITRAVEFALGDGTFSEIWSYGDELESSSPILGQARRLPDGDTLYLETVTGTLRQVSPEGEARWTLTLEGDPIGQVELVSMAE